jgi:hypothetical protein
MDGLRAIRLAARDLWEESSLLVLAGLVGGVLSLLVLSLPFVLAAHYAAAARIAEDQVTTLRSWFEEGWASVGFHYQWFLLLILVSLLPLSGILFYGRFATAWALPLRWFCVLFLTIWLLPQPFVPALYWQQEDRRLRTALRNAFVLTATDPLSVMLFWVVVLAIGATLAYFIWPMLLLLPGVAAVFSTRILWLKISPSRPTA